MKNIVAVETAKSIDNACVALENAVAEHHFGILHVHNVRQTLANKGIAFDREVCTSKRTRNLASDRGPR